MDYKSLYERIIEKATKRFVKDGYYENHHIIPSSLGGNNGKDNLVRLTAREHFICHYLLSKIYEEGSVEWIKMNKAFMMMKSPAVDGQRYVSHLYSLSRKRFAKAQKLSQSGDKNSQYGKVWIFNEELKQTKKVNEIDLDFWIEAGWIKGRVLKFVYMECPICHSKRLKRRDKEPKFCSKECLNSFVRDKEKKRIEKEDEKLKQLSSKFEIKFGSLIENKPFILDALKNGFKKHRILLVLHCNKGKENYEQLKRIEKNALVSPQITNL